jgi:hypothetical protein
MCIYGARFVKNVKFDFLFKNKLANFVPFSQAELAQLRVSIKEGNQGQSYGRREFLYHDFDSYKHLKQHLLRLYSFNLLRLYLFLF